mmetsp:Transcript_31221/g.30648  ORF Transcript_31221/g.30648 Transcript_31221/m.30648 type:complete len:130 (+) Transcript_31221:239-628(+)
MALFEKVEEEKRAELQRRDQEYIQKLMDEERQKLEEEKQMQKQREEREYSILRITNLFHNVDYDQAKNHLEKENWRTDLVISQLQQKYAAEKREEERRETSLLQMLQQFPNMDYDMAQGLLIASNWDLN